MNRFPYKHINVLVMPTDYCNMNCVYCFNGKRTCQEKVIMSDVTLKRIFEVVIPFYTEVTFIWHGGEPLSVGKSFYERVIELQKEINIYDIPVRNSIQTNLTLLDEDFAKFLVKNGFRIGSSYDGITNEETRHNSAHIIEGYKTLKKSGGKNGFICVVQKKNIDYLIENYEWFKRHKINYNLNQYMTHTPSHDELWVPQEDYIKKMCDFFDYWAHDTECDISVSYFERFIKYIVFREKEICCYNSCMGKYIGIRFDGSIYSCNRDFPEKLCFGNVHEYTDIHECFDSEGFTALLEMAIKRRKKCKETCDIFEFCAGGCNSAALMGGNIEMCNEYVCETMRGIYKYIEKKIRLWINADNIRQEKYLNPHLIAYLKGKKHSKT